MSEIEELRVELFALQIAARVHIDSIDEDGLADGETLEALRQAEQQASDYLMSIPLTKTAGGQS